jgi:glycosyltransferase involved in cell wall biosynthesis
MARVSIVVAARDAAATIGDTLASVAAQTYGDWDLILVDDASSDRTGELAAALGDRVRVLRNATPIGPAGARNRAVEHATGELIATLDADDLWMPAYLERQISAYDRAVTEGRPVAVVCCDAQLLGPGGLELEQWSDRVKLPGRVTLDVLLRENVVYNSVLMSRAVFVENDGYRVELVGVEDFDLMLRIAERGGEIVVNDEVLATYRLRPDSLSSHSARMAAGTRVVYERALTRGRLNLTQRALARRQWRLHALLERRAHLSAAREAGRPAVLDGLRLAPLTARVALEHPERWAPWLRHGPRRAAAGRHAG